LARLTLALSLTSRYARYTVNTRFSKKPTPTDILPGEKFVHKRSLGQNFLTSDVVPTWMTDAAMVKKKDIVFEIGPGTGMLTKSLLERGAHVIAVEADSRALSELENRFATEIKTGKLTLHHGDAREITPEKLGLNDHSFKVVANIPYYLSGFLLRTLLESNVQPSAITFLIQKELAHRIVRDKKESLLSLSVKVFGEPTYYKNVSRGHFNPKPNVDSAILVIQNITKNNLSPQEIKLFFEILHLGLGKKRKQLLSNLSHIYERTRLEGIFTTLNLPFTVRGEDVPLPKWLELTTLLANRAV
jgi:16S rRNA (adenine1518-N6/adenine1519-N6)-dimethyltransferase